MLICIEGDAYQNAILIEKARLGGRSPISPGRMAVKADASHASIRHIGYTGCIELSWGQAIQSAGTHQRIEQSAFLWTE